MIEKIGEREIVCVCGRERERESGTTSYQNDHDDDDDDDVEEEEIPSVEVFKMSFANDKQRNRIYTNKIYSCLR